MAKMLGLIAEDTSDVEVLTILASKLTKRKFTFKHFVGKGCARLAAKAPGWCKNLHSKGCSHVVLVHDLDRNNPADLRKKLLAALATAPQAKKAVVIPIEELEAWLLSDELAIKRALNLRKKPVGWSAPETVASPKEKLRDAVWTLSEKKKEYIHTVHNKLIAAEIDVTRIRNKCPSFGDFEIFINEA